jgi:hypothetical protein
MYAISRAAANDTRIWGMNPVVVDTDHSGASHTNVTLTGIEVDLGCHHTSVTCQGITIQGGSSVNVINGSGVRVAKISSAAGASLPNAFLTDNGAAKIGLQLQAQSTAAKSLSQIATLCGLDGGSVLRCSNWQTSPNGDFLLNPRSGFGLGVGTGTAPPRGQTEITVAGNVPDPLNANPANGFNLTNGNIGLSQGVASSGPFRGWLQARNNVGANNTAYPLTLNELGGNVGINNNNPGEPLDVTGNVRSSAQLISTQATGRPPLAVSSTTAVAKLGIHNCSGCVIEHVRVSGCATAAVRFNTCDTIVMWSSAFANARYTATCTGDAVTRGVPIIEGIDISAAKTESAITVRTIALTAAAAQFTAINCTAVHD